MKKLYLFLRDGKLFYGSSLDDATAFEVVNSDANIQLALGLALGGFVQHEQLYDLPKGWTVEIEYRLKESDGMERVITEEEYQKLKSEKWPQDVFKIALLIPLKEQSSGIAAVGVPEYGSMAEEYIATWPEPGSPPPQAESQEDCPGKCKFPNCECSLYRRVIVAGVLDRQGISNEILNLWEQVQIWYGDIRKEETDEQFLKRLQNMFTITRRVKP